MSVDQFVIDQICAFITSTDQTKDDRIEEYARIYSDACENANRRLERCKLFMTTGHRSQAIRFAEQEPPLNSLVEQLSLKGMVDLWADVVASFGWARFQPLKTEVLSSIDEAYVVEKQIADVLYKYRESCLAKASLSDRLLLVRQLAAMDSTNPCWRSDIETFERGLMAELARTGDAALRVQDFEKLTLLVSQHDTQDWELEITPEYSNFLTAAVPTVYRKYTIPKDVAEFRSALKRKDVNELVRLRTKIQNSVSKAKTLSPSFKLNNEVQSDFDRISAELEKFENAQKLKAYQNDLEILQIMMGDKFTTEGLNEAYNRVKSHGFPIPPTIDTQVQICLSDEKQTKTLTVVAISLLICLVIGLSVLAFLMWNKTVNR